MEYRDILFSEENNQDELNIKNKKRVNNFAWKGQFSPEFIEFLLNMYSQEESKVYDPFLGSGTVLSECAHKGLHAEGVELNPSAFYMSKVYTMVNVPANQRKEFISFFDDKINNVFSEKEMYDFILECQNNLTGKYMDIYSLLIILSDLDKNDLNIELLAKNWLKIKRVINELPYSKKKIVVNNADARDVPYESSFFDLVITSPPYINVFNYHQNYRKSVEKLGYDVLSFAKSEFGSNRKNRGNRYLTVIQYTIDMALSIAETLRVSKIDSRLIYVVGVESTVLGQKFYNSKIIYSIFKEIFGISIFLKQQREFKNRFGKLIKEDILHFKKAENIEIDTQEIIKKARELGVSELESAMQTIIDPSKKELINKAILSSKDVKESELRKFG